MSKEEKEKREELTKIMTTYDYLYSTMRYDHTKIDLEALKAINQVIKEKLRR